MFLTYNIHNACLICTCHSRPDALLLGVLTMSVSLTGKFCSISTTQWVVHHISPGPLTKIHCDSFLHHPTALVWKAKEPLGPTKQNNNANVCRTQYSLLNVYLECTQITPTCSPPITVACSMYLLIMYLF